MDRGTWGPDGPPEEAYSRVSDDTRYLGLHADADRLVADLVHRYAVEAEPATVTGRWRGGVVRATRLVPAGDGAPLTVVWTGFGLVVRAGHAYELGLPGCGCDACDEDPDDLARDLDDVATAVAAGGLTETRRHRRLGADPWRIALDGVNGSSGTLGPGSPGAAIPVGTADWPPWPLR